MLGRVLTLSHAVVNKPKKVVINQLLELFNLERNTVPNLEQNKFRIYFLIIRKKYKYFFKSKFLTKEF